ncbi:prolyl endopeptidase-like [Antechinus flavipes]|uniref:prolyl endopeptidase-like n=1 Tax=Antechinus flavipes TaxID=38775 RepID=UPI002235C192|nr:prolyl endopeptidase-like [Antechinus flavipes]
MHQTARFFLQTLKFSFARFGKYTQKQPHVHHHLIDHCPWIKVRKCHNFKCLQSKYKKLIMGRNITSRKFCYADLLNTEQENTKSLLINYMDSMERLKKKIEAFYDKHLLTLDNLEIQFGDFIYYEEDGCILRLKIGDGFNNCEVLLRLEELSLYNAFVERIRISPGEEYMAASIKTSDSEESTCVIVKLGKYPEVEDFIPNVFSFEWVQDGILFYTCQKNLRCCNVFRTSFGNKKYTECIYTEQDPRFFVDLYCTRDRFFLTINSNSKTTSEVWLVDCHQPWNLPVLVQKRNFGVMYHIEHRNNELYILTNYGEPSEYKLMKTSVDSCSIKNWQHIYTWRRKTKLIDMVMFKDHCIIFLKYCNQLYLNTISLNDHSVQFLKLPAWACACQLDTQPQDSSSDTCSFQLSSPVHPPRHYIYMLGKSGLYEQAEQEKPVMTDCHMARLEAKSKDGTLVPVTVFYKGNCENLQKKPLLIHVYGAYGIDLNMNFKPEKQMLIEDGWILAYCHVRGGGELGLHWHTGGCLDNKLNGLDDLEACIKSLHNLGFSEPTSTALTAYSAGGILAGTLCNTNPKLIRAVALQAPFLDLLNTMLDTQLPLTIEELEEWGDPTSDDKYRDYIKSYCPYQNIRPQTYPSILITACENDQRVPIGGILKYIQRLRKVIMDQRHNRDHGRKIPNIILDVQTGGSHATAFGEDSVIEVAKRLAFLYKELGLDDTGPLN